MLYAIAVIAIITLSVSWYNYRQAMNQVIKPSKCCKRKTDYNK